MPRTPTPPSLALPGGSSPPLGGLNVLGVASGAYVTGLIGDRAGLTAGLLWSLLPAAAGVLLVGLVGIAQMRRT